MNKLKTLAWNASGILLVLGWLSGPLAPHGTDVRTGVGPLVEPNGSEIRVGIGPLAEPNGSEIRAEIGPLAEPNGTR